jgi:aspartyl-tRNA(Asn)/glutamyl-tRNA(Gln) amidotransferase subunit C
MSIRPEDVQHAAKLAEIAVGDDELPRLAAQLGRIVEYVEQLREVPESERAEPWLGGPLQAPLRADLVAPAPLAHPVAEMAPEFVDGFFVVPRRVAMADE